MVFKGFFSGKTGTFQLCELLVMLLWTPNGGDSYQEKTWLATDHRSQQLGDPLPPAASACVPQEVGTPAQEESRNPPGSRTVAETALQ